MACRTNFGTHLLNEFICIVTHHPILLCTCNIYDEVFKYVFTQRRVCNFRVKLEAPPLLRNVFNSDEISIRCSRCLFFTSKSNASISDVKLPWAIFPVDYKLRTHCLKPIRNLMQLVSMTHPHDELFRQPSKKWRVASFYSRDRCFAILSFLARGNFSTKHVSEFL